MFRMQQSRTCTNTVINTTGIEEIGNTFEEVDTSELALTFETLNPYYYKGLRMCLSTSNQNIGIDCLGRLRERTCRSP